MGLKLYTLICSECGETLGEYTIDDLKEEGIWYEWDGEMLTTVCEDCKK